MTNNPFDPAFVERLEELLVHIERFLAEAEDVQGVAAEQANKDLARILKQFPVHVDHTRQFRNFLEALCQSLRALLQNCEEPFDAFAGSSDSTDFLWSGFRSVTQKPPQPQCSVPAPRDQSQVAISKVQFSALAPKRLLKGSYSILNIVMYEDACRQVVEDLLASSDTALQETKSGVLRVQNGANIRVVLSSPDVQIDDSEEFGIWNGEYLLFNFAVALPQDSEKKQALFTATVYINDLIATRLKFVVKCFSAREQKLDIIREDVLTAFVSYASQDRSRVALLIQGMKKARPDMDIFFDVDSLRSGENWEEILSAEIERRDILYLCWSSHARASKWVDAEWRHALRHKGLDCIEPIPFEPPDVCPPPEELRQKHFNDKMLYIIQKS